jgi:Tol biopolymer transport system component
MWGAGGRSVIYAADAGIVERQLPGAVDRILLPAVPGEEFFGLGPSPSGDRLAFTKTIGRGANAVCVLGVREASGAVSEIRRAKGAGSLQFLDWTADGTHILYAAGGGRSWGLWRVSAGGGEPVDMKVGVESGRARVSLHPDGRALTYSTGITAFEIWVMRGIAR